VRHHITSRVLEKQLFHHHFPKSGVSLPRFKGISTHDEDWQTAPVPGRGHSAVRESLNLQ
jgi:hypothetical protein